jgi:hypothetical protein
VRVHFGFHGLGVSVDCDYQRSQKIVEYLKLLFSFMGKLKIKQLWQELKR